MKHLPIYILLIFIIWSCKQNQVDGIEFGQTLYSNQSYGQNKKLSELITQTLNGNSKALMSILELDCGGGAGCYDLGSICVQLAYKVGEADFSNMAMDLNNTQKGSLNGLLDVGFLYGGYSGKNCKTEFPMLYEVSTK